MLVEVVAQRRFDPLSVNLRQARRLLARLTKNQREIEALLLRLRAQARAASRDGTNSEFILQTSLLR